MLIKPLHDPATLIVVPSEICLLMPQTVQPAFLKSQRHGNHAVLVENADDAHASSLSRVDKG